ncbi:PREDICTED: zinc finger CCCH domain-containing protein 63-like isoform X2 [Populus euphratica]|uniref:Zinc finger CCCH domain-containing protein 63-like isoform X2 n=1 Tax=Populus euphratica TaxID=75702 RepID=A0AAJ6X5D0_POPEU|nr:PREDICTED: zinc finger CCCH domain-containing protein 63-like isoform X2 [Populus euphratica]
MAAGDALLSGPDKLYTGSKDETVKSLGFPVWTGPWVFVGLPNAVKARWYCSIVNFQLYLALILLFHSFAGKTEKRLLPYGNLQILLPF